MEKKMATNKQVLDSIEALVDLLEQVRDENTELKRKIEAVELELQLLKSTPYVTHHPKTIKWDNIEEWTDDSTKYKKYPTYSTTNKMIF
tara:strand:+ start:1620 stop:1886 length:267 start_codon:yes stop_codon:yes gene_type:complete